MKSLLEESQENRIEILGTSEYMPRVHEVQMPCQWLKHCYNGKCPAFVRVHGNYYCARAKRR